MTDLIMLVLDLIIKMCTEHLPSYDFDSTTYQTVTDSVTTIVRLLADVNFIIPLTDIVQIIGLSIALHLFKFGLFCGNWIVRRVCDILP